MSMKLNYIYNTFYFFIIVFDQAVNLFIEINYVCDNFWFILQYNNWLHLVVNLSDFLGGTWCE